VSPVFPTASHPGGRTLGRVQAGLVMRGLTVPAIALGGMDARRAKSLKALGFHGWAAIDAWIRNPR
ncbi:MAG: thiamine phosphate synthase, partial [Sphingomonadales bacterium]